MKSACVTLTVVAAMGLAARAQQGPDPCAAATFNEKACKRSVRQGGFCSQGAWVPVTYHEPYPYYYDLYKNHVSSGGAVTPLATEKCGRGGGTGNHTVSRGGFGGTAHGGHA